MESQYVRTALFANKIPGGVLVISDLEQHPGNIFFVDSGHANASDAAGYGLTPDRPYATIDYAIGNCTASNGDVIYVMPGHSESTSTASAELFDLDVAGVSIIGLGKGDLRPTLTLEVATATIKIAAANCRLSNIRLIGNITDLATGLEITADAVGSMVDHCYFADSATNKDMLIVMAIEADADRLRIEDNQIHITTGGEATEGIKFAGGSDGTIIARNYMFGDWKTNGAIDLSAAASLGVQVHDNLIVNEDASAGLCMKIHASVTGLVTRNIVAGSKTNTETINGGTACHFAENYGTDLPATTGILTPSTATNWSA